MRFRRLPGSLALSLLLAASLVPDVHAQQSVRRENAQFVASSRGEVYYWVGCDSWKRLSRVDLRFFRTAADAQAAGYRPSRARGCAPQLNTAPIRPAIGGRADCVVARIIDGDTFQCEGGSRIRLLLVDADELNQSVYADSAVLLVRRLMRESARVQLEFDVQLFDRNQRILAYAYAGSVFINRELARRGLAHVTVYPPNVRQLDALRAAADSARREKLGIWRGGAFACSPADFRARLCRQRG